MSFVPTVRAAGLARGWPPHRPGLAALRGAPALILLAAVLVAAAHRCLAAPAAALGLPTGVRLPLAPAGGYATLQPKSPPPARRLYVADVRALSREQQLLLASLQGLVNRDQPRIYLISEDDDQFWLSELRRRGWTGEPILVADPMSLLTTFRSEYAGAVVADPNVYVSPCVAVDYAGIESLVIATPALAQQYRLPIKEDLRGRFAGDADALRYARTALLPRCDPRLMLCLDPPLLGLQVDDIVARRGMAFWVTGPRAQDKPGADGPAEEREVALTLASAPLNGIVRGYWWHGDQQGLDEGPGVALGSRYGKITTVSDYVDDFSVLSGYRLASLRQKPQPAAPPLDRSKVYVAVTVTDGDNLSPWKGVYKALFREPLHGAFPVGWGMGPTLLDVAPVQAAWYYDHAAPTDEFLCDVSGAGYVNPSVWGASLADRDAALREYYGVTARYMRRMDMRTLRIMYVDPPQIAAALSLLPATRFLVPDYSYAREAGYTDLTYALPSGQDVFRAATDGPAGGMAAEIKERVGAARPAFVNATIAPWGLHLADLKQMLDTLGPGYVAVTPSQLDALYREAAGK